jgi:hypothetical protein
MSDIMTRRRRLFWRLVGKIAESGLFGDVDSRDVVEYLLLKCKHVKYITTNSRDGMETIDVRIELRKDNY